ncbi:CoA-transferase [Streptomyces sp. NPDC004838]
MLGARSDCPPGHSRKDGSPKQVERCSLPLTGQKVVDRVITDLGVLDITPAGFVLREPAPGVSVDEVRDRTGAPLSIDLITTTV